MAWRRDEAKTATARTGRLLISIDVELAWGAWDRVPDFLPFCGDDEREIMARLVKLLDKYEQPATFAIVGAMLDDAPDVDFDRPGESEWWYGPDVVETIRGGTQPHEIGSHSYAHRLYPTLSEAEAAADLDRAGAIHAANGLPMRSFVFPANRVAHVEALAASPIEIFRGLDAGLIGRLDEHDRARQLASMAARFVPHVPPTVEPRRAVDGLIEIEASRLFTSRQGARRAIPDPVVLWSWMAGLDRAVATGTVFHLWFHPCNFYWHRDRQFALLERFLSHVLYLKATTRLQPVTMADLVS